MTTYYKIVTAYLPFRQFYNLDDTLWVPYGTQVSAQPPFPIEYRPLGQPYIESDVPVIHFCDNAFDTMLWYSVFAPPIGNRRVMIYKIQPLTKIVKQRCIDGIGLYQCGANTIKFLGKVDVNNMFDLAVADFRENHKKKTEEYPNLQMTKILSDWLKHRQSKYIY